MSTTYTHRGIHTSGSRRAPVQFEIARDEKVRCDADAHTIRLPFPCR